MKPSPRPSNHNLPSGLSKRNPMQQRQERVRDIERHQSFLVETDANQQQRLDNNLEDSTTAENTLKKMGSYLTNYIMGILCRIMNLLQVPISLAIVGVLFYVIVAQIQTRLVASLSAISPMFCNSPLSYLLFICPSEVSEALSIPATPQSDTIHVDFPALTQLQIHAFGDLLDENAYSSRVGLELKKAEAATGDLGVIVQLSQLVGRENLGTALVQFGVDTANAGRSLIVLDGKINAAMDRIIAMNDYTLKEISRLSELALLNPGQQSLLDNSATHVAKLFDKAMSFMHSELHSLKSISESTLNDQTKLEEQLKTIHMLVAMEEVAINLEKDELLGNLWGFFGGNRRELQQFNYNLALLQAISIHRKQAQSYVINTLQTLEETSVDLEILRGRIVQLSLDENTTLPLEVHIQSLKAGIHRLRGNRIRERTFEPPPRSGLIEGPPAVSQANENPSVSMRV